MNEEIQIGNLMSQAGGNTTRILMDNDFDPHALRPWISPKNGQAYITRTLNGVKKNIRFAANAMSPLRKGDWEHVDAAVTEVARPMTNIVSDLRAAGLAYSIPDGWAKGMLQYERVTDISGATISMDGLRRGQSDRQAFDIVNMPLPLIHKDCELPARQVASSKTQGHSGIDVQYIQAATARVLETAEMLALGTLSSYTYGGGTIYGMLNFPNRITATITAPTAGGWVPATAVNEVNGMVQLACTAFHRGPYRLYYSLPWKQYMNMDYIITGGATVATQTLRERLLKIDNIQAVTLADFMHTGFTLLLVEMKIGGGTIRIVTGMDVMVVEWESAAGMQLHFKVMCIILPQLKCDTNGNCGLVHGAVAA
jgi:hypothetical protein